MWEAPPDRRAGAQDKPEGEKSLGAMLVDNVVTDDEAETFTKVGRLGFLVLLEGLARCVPRMRAGRDRVAARCRSNRSCAPPTEHGKIELSVDQVSIVRGTGRIIHRRYRYQLAAAAGGGLAAR